MMHGLVLHSFFLLPVVLHVALGYLNYLSYTAIMLFKGGD